MSEEPNIKRSEILLATLLFISWLLPWISIDTKSLCGYSILQIFSSQEINPQHFLRATSYLTYLIPLLVILIFFNILNRKSKKKIILSSFFAGIISIATIIIVIIGNSNPISVLNIGVFLTCFSGLGLIITSLIKTIRNKKVKSFEHQFPKTIPTLQSKQNNVTTTTEVKTEKSPKLPDQKDERSLSIKVKLEFIKKIDEIPALPQVVSNVISKLENPEITFNELEKSISLDPALVAYILRVTNSPFYGLKAEVMTIIKAIAILGESNLKSLMIGYGVRLIYKNIKESNIQNILWNHAISVAVLSKVISEEIYGVVHSQIYVFGLLHDIGKMILLMNDAEKFKKSLKKQSNEAKDSVTIEYELYGFSHIETGYFLLSKFGFSNEIIDIIQFHHNPEFCSSENKLVWIISLANSLSHILGEKKNQIDLTTQQKMLNLSDHQIKTILESGKKQIETHLSQF